MIQPWFCLLRGKGKGYDGKGKPDDFIGSAGKGKGYDGKGFADYGKGKDGKGDDGKGGKGDASDGTGMEGSPERSQEYSSRGASRFGRAQRKGPTPS